MSWGRRLCLSSVLAAPLLAELRWRRSQQPPSDRWRQVPVRPRGSCLLGISHRPLQAEAFGLDPEAALRRALALPFDVVRLGAYWNRIEPRPGVFDPRELDRALELVEGAGKRVLLAVGAVKTFGYPELFVPAHRLSSPIPEGSLVTTSSHPELAEAAQTFVRQVVERYRGRSCIWAWQVENEAVDPLGMEHSWRLTREFVTAEVAVVRGLDPSRPILMNGFVPLSTLGRVTQAWRTRAEGDSLAAALEIADWVGLDIYSRIATFSTADHALYLDGDALPWNRVRWRWMAKMAKGRPLLVTEGQAEPWEGEPVPPDPVGRVPYSCPPERLILNYNRALGPPGGGPLVSAYIFWGWEYWLRREASGDRSYLGAIDRVLAEA